MRVDVRGLKVTLGTVSPNSGLVSGTERQCVQLSRAQALEEEDCMGIP